MLWESLLIGGILLYSLYRWATNNHDYFEKRGIPYDKPFPIFGSFKDTTFRKRSMFDVVIDIYNKHNGPIYGIFDQRNPIYLIRDPDLLRQITVKDFDHFVNHRTIFGDADENLFGNSLFQMTNTKWRDMRSTLSPVFTGSKMRQMFQLINQVAEESAKYLRQLQTKDADGIELDMKDYTTRFTNDIIASTAFGLQVNSFEKKDNKFYMMGEKVTKFTRWINIKFLLFMHCKKLMRLLNFTLFDKHATNYFRNLVLDAMKYRKEHDIRRPDMINMLMEARGIFTTDTPKAHNREWTDTEIVAQCFLFFFAGFDTSAVQICFAAHEIMENSEVQEKLLAEIDEVNQQLEGKPLTYEALHGMKYLDMVVCETLRKWPGAIALDRVCTKDYLYEGDDGRFEIKKNEAIWVPVAGIHRDPQYYEDPSKFCPERFSDENKDKIKPFTYLPFGAGPRNCIGSRFALLEAKALLYYLVRDYRIAAAKKTNIPIELAASGFQLIPKNGFWLKFIARSNLQEPQLL